MGPIMMGGGGKTPHYKRLMMFVDGTNFLIELAKEVKVDFKADKPPTEALGIASLRLEFSWQRRDIVKIRNYWFSSYQGSEDYHDRLAQELRNNGFEPVLFKKRKGKKEKGVDIGLATEMLVNSFNQNFDVGLLVAGDEDYVGLVKEAKRYGPEIWGAFFTHGLSPKLKVALDDFADIGQCEIRNQTKYESLLDALTNNSQGKA